MISIFLLLSIFINILFGVFLLRIVKDSKLKNMPALWISLVAFTATLWAIGDFLMLFAQTENATNIGRLLWTVAPMLTMLFAYEFSRTIGDKSKLPKIDSLVKHIIRLVTIAGAIFYLFKPDMVVQTIKINGSGINTVYGTQTQILIYSLFFLILAFGTSMNLYYQKNRSTGLNKRQLQFSFYGTQISSTGAFITNLALPILGNFDYIWVGPCLTVGYLGTFTYAIIRHKLFDIKLIIVRSFGYLLSVGLLVAVFGALSSLVVSRISETNRGYDAIIINAIILAIALTSYPPVKRYFDRITNKIFYKDAYDPQEFLDQLNKSIVSNIEIGILLRHTTSIIEENLKSSFVQIVVPKTESTAQRIAGTKDVKYSDHEINYMRGRLVGLKRKIIAIDELGSEEDELQKIMNKHDISVLVHLSATSYGQDQTIAFMIFGNKKSGNVYSKPDLKIVEIIADELVIAIQNALRFEEIQEFNVTLQSKVNTATTKLRKTNDKLKAIDATKDEFISMASHQLRTPLTSVKGYLSMVLEGDAGEINETQRKLLDQAFVSSQRMVYLIADLLNVSRLRTGKFIIDAGQANLAEVVEGEVSQLKEQANAKHINLSYEKPKEFPNLVIDETKTRQVVMNFVDNALYYTPAGGKIEVSLTEDKNHIYFMVKDNGLGVPKDEQKHLFTKFYRAKNARNVRPDGTGLGLFMAKKVITAQGGNILFESKEGKGSTFGFSFSKKLLAVPDGEGHKA